MELMKVIVLFRAELDTRAAEKNAVRRKAAAGHTALDGAGASEVRRCRCGRRKCNRAAEPVSVGCRGITVTNE